MHSSEPREPIRATGEHRPALSAPPYPRAEAIQERRLRPEEASLDDLLVVEVGASLRRLRVHRQLEELEHHHDDEPGREARGWSTCSAAQRQPAIQRDGPLTRGAPTSWTWFGSACCPSVAACLNCALSLYWPGAGPLINRCSLDGDIG
jgi:hypothetical protein